MRAGYRVWYDEYSMAIGDSLVANVQRGLAACDFGIVILSPAFLRKQWPKAELAALLARELGGDSDKVVLPVWHNVTAAQVRAELPLLADRLAANTTDPVDEIVRKLRFAIRARGFDGFVTQPNHPIDAAKILANIELAEYVPDHRLDLGGVANLQKFITLWELDGALTVEVRIDLEPEDRERILTLDGDRTLFLRESHGMHRVWFEAYDRSTELLGVTTDGIDLKALAYFVARAGLIDDADIVFAERIDIVGTTNTVFARIRPAGTQRHPFRPR